MAEKSGKVGAFYAQSGTGHLITAESHTLTANKVWLDQKNVDVSAVYKNRSGGGGEFTRWYCTPRGYLTINDATATNSMSVNYRWWAEDGKAKGTTWVSSTAYAVGYRMKPTVPNSRFYYCTKAGTSSASEPSWITTAGTTDTDGTVIWTCGLENDGIMKQYGGFFNWSLDDTADVVETTDFQDSGHKTYIACLDGWTAAAERHWLNSGMFRMIGSKTVAKFYVDNDDTAKGIGSASDTGSKYEGYALVIGISPTVAVDSLVNESLSFQGTGQLTYESGA